MKKIKDEGFVRTAVKGVITFSMMIAVNDIFGFYAPTRSSQTLHRVGCNIAGMSLGYVIGQIAADAAVDGIERAVAAYKGEEIHKENE